MIIEIVTFINDLSDAVRLNPVVFEAIEFVVDILDAVTPDAEIDFILYEDGSIEVVD